jgi:hypothetical protein
MRDWYCYNAGTAYERLHQYSVCDPALEILAEVHQYIQWKTDGNLKTTTAFLEKKRFYLMSYCTSYCMLKAYNLYH